MTTGTTTATTTPTASTASSPRDLRDFYENPAVPVASGPSRSLRQARMLAGVQPVFSEVSLRGIHGRPGSEVVGHLRLYTARALREFVAASGFEVVRPVSYTHLTLPTICSV